MQKIDYDRGWSESPSMGVDVSGESHNADFMVLSGGDLVWSVCRFTYFATLKGQSSWLRQWLAVSQAPAHSSC